MTTRVVFGLLAMILTMAFAVFACGWVAGYAWGDVEGEKAAWGFLGFGVPAMFVGSGASWLLREHQLSRRIFGSACLVFAGGNAIALFVGMYQSIDEGSMRLAATVFFGFGIPLIVAGGVGIRTLAGGKA